MKTSPHRSTHSYRTFIIRGWLLLFFLTAIGSSHAAAPFFQKGLITGPTPAYSHPRYVSLARLTNQDLLAVYSGMGNGDPDQVGIWASYSQDHGQTWSSPILALDRPHIMDADPSIVVGQDRVLIVSTTRKAQELIETKFYTATSRDQGRTWAPGEIINHTHNYSSGKLQAATRLRNGRLLMPFCWDAILEHKGSVIKEQAERNMLSVASVLFSDDDGQSWQPGGDLEIKGVPGGGGINGLDEICIAELADGSIYALCRTGSDRLYEARSSDRGLTWSKPKPSPFVASNAPASMIALDQPKGTVVVVWNETAKGDRKPLSVAYSQDNCRSWSQSKIITADYSPYPSITQAANGQIVASWFEQAAGGTAIAFARFNWEWLTAPGS